jgi:hypothetical protein
MGATPLFSPSPHSQATVSPTSLLLCLMSASGDWSVVAATKFEPPLPSPLRLGEPRLQAVFRRMNTPLTFPSSPLCCRTPPFPSPPLNTVAPSLFFASPSICRYGEPPISSPCLPPPRKPPSARRQHLIDDRPSSGRQ